MIRSIVAVCGGVVLCAITSSSALAQTQASCTFTLFALPETTSSIPYGINDSGTVVGMAIDYNGIERGFTRTASGVVTYYSAPNTGNTYAGFTDFTGRNDNGVNVGIYKTPKSNPSVPEGFLLNGSTFSSIKEPKSVWGTNAYGINKWGSVVGNYLDYYSNAHGFKRYSSGSFITLNYPGAKNTFPMGINDNGVIVGAYSPGHGFIYNAGNWATLNYPKATATNLVGISDSKVIVGNSNTTKQGTAFLYEKGTFKVIAVPHTYATVVNGISANGLITGRTNLDGSEAGWRGFRGLCQ